MNVLVTGANGFVGRYLPFIARSALYPLGVPPAQRPESSGCKQVVEELPVLPQKYEEP